MKLQRIRLSFLVMTIALASVDLLAQPQQPLTTAEDKRISRLVGLAKVWGTVKFFHPFPAYRQIDWDQALVDAIPKVNKTKSPEEYAAAVNSMLAALNDPETRAKIEKAKTSKNEKILTAEIKSPARFENGVLYYDLLAASRVTIKDYRRLDEFVGEVENLLPQAKAVIIDARGLDETNTEVLDEFAYEMKVLMPAILDQNITLGAIRYRMHHGYAAQAGESTSGYYSSFVTDAPQPFATDYRGKTPPMIFLVDEKNSVAPILSGLQTIGKVFVVADGATSTGGDFYTINIGENVLVKMRKTELVNPDGSIGFAPDLIVEKGQALKTVQRLLTENKFTSDRKKITAEQIGLVSQKDKALAEMEFPAKEYRLLALFRFWNIINYFYPYKNLTGTDWNTILPKYIPQFEANQDAAEYQFTVRAMVTEIHDSHGGLQNAEASAQRLGTFQPPVTVSYIERQTVVNKVLDIKLPIKPGDIVLTIDGETSEKRRTFLARYFAASTPQALMRDVHRNFFRGQKDSMAKLTVRGADGVVRTIEIPRSFGRDNPSLLSAERRTTPVFTVLPSGFGYVDLDRLPANDINKMFETVKDTPAIVFDMRGYPRGDLRDIIRHLTDKPLSESAFSLPIIDAKNLVDLSLTSIPSYTLQVASEQRERYQGEIYKGKIIVLINEWTQSAAETVADNFARARPETIFIGMSTAGADGDVTYGVLPGNLIFSFSGNNLRRYDGAQLQRVGIKPNVEIAPTIRGIAGGKDEILEAAVKFLQKN